MDSCSKVCIVCCGLINDYEFLVSIVDVGQYDSEEMVVLPMHPTFRISGDDFGESTVCVLGNKLYLFEGGYMCYSDQVKKGVFTFPLPEGVPSNLPLKKYMMKKEAVGMNGMKIWPKAVVTPDGGKILVFSSVIGLCHSDESIVDFELYDAALGIWHTLPNLPSKRPDCAQVDIKIMSFTFMDENVFFLRTSVGVFTLNIQKPTAWIRGGFRGDECIPHHTGNNLLLIERKICVVDTLAYDIRVRDSHRSFTIEKENIFATLAYSFPNLTEFPLPPFPSSGHSYESGGVTLLEHERGTKFKVCFLHGGINDETKHAEFMLQVYKTYLSPCTNDLTASRKRKVREDNKMWWERTLELPSTFKLQSFKIVVEENFQSLCIHSFSSVS